MGRTGSMGIGVGPAWSPTSRQMVSARLRVVSVGIVSTFPCMTNGAATVRRESRDGLLRLGQQVVIEGGWLRNRPGAFARELDEPIDGRERKHLIGVG